MRIAIVFPGQGTQAPAMGTPWVDQPSWRIATDADAILNEPVSQLLTDASSDDLSSTRNAQLAVLLTSLVVWDACGTDLAREHEIVGFAGHSLGQVTALIAAGTLSPADGITFAATRAAATQAAANAHPGRMAALVGATIEQAETACAATGEAWIANDNAPGQVVIAGTPDGLEIAIEAAKAAGVRRALPLAVGGAFHTPLMSEARDVLRTALGDVAFADPLAPVVSNHDAIAHRDGEGWRERLVAHPTLPVRWRESMVTLVDTLGAEAFVEVGHGSMIAGVAKRTVAGTPVIGIAQPEHIAGALERLSAPTDPTA